MTKAGVLALVGAAAAVAGEVVGPLEAGVARVELTPPLAMKAALGGYGARLSKPATGVHDGVWAKALVLRRGDLRFALVTADVLGFPPRFKGAVLEQLAGSGWTDGQVLLLPSHTHTSFDMMALHPDNSFGIPQVGVFHPALFEHTAARLAEAIRKAAERPRPVLAGTQTVVVPGRNRNRRGGGTNDPNLTVTRLDAAGGGPLAVLANWTAHPTFMDEEDMLFSGDWPGHLQRILEALIGSGAVALYYNGAEGDQSPVPPAEAASRWERAERYGREMGILAWQVWKDIRPSEVGTFRYRTETIPLPPRQWHADFMKTGGAEYGLNETMMRGFVEKLVPDRTHSTALRLGSLTILGAPGEMAAALGLEAKARAREALGVDTVTIGGLADEWVSYALPSAEYARGGYEASMSFYGETLGAVLVEGMVRGAAALK
jgi:hypothetical protein